MAGSSRLATFSAPSAATDPFVNGFLTWSYDIAAASQAGAITAATIYLCKIPVPKTITVSNITVRCPQAGTSYTNAQLGLYDSTGVLLGASAIQASAGTNGFGVTTGTTLGITPVAVTGGPSVFVWGAMHAGTNGATAIQVQQSAANSGVIFNIGTSGATRRAMTVTGHATNDLATIGSLAGLLAGGTSQAGLWFGLS